MPKALGNPEISVPNHTLRVFTMPIYRAAVIRPTCVEVLGSLDTPLLLMEDVEFYGWAIRGFGVTVIDRVAIYYRLGPSLIYRPKVQSMAINSCQAKHGCYRAEYGTLQFYALDFRNVAAEQDVAQVSRLRSSALV